MEFDEDEARQKRKAPIPPRPTDQLKSLSSYNTPHQRRDTPENLAKVNKGETVGAVGPLMTASQKSFNISNPKAFKQNVTEKRSYISTDPLLTDNAISNSKGPANGTQIKIERCEKKTHDGCGACDQCLSKAGTPKPVTVHNKSKVNIISSHQTLSVLSVYVRAPDGQSLQRRLFYGNPLALKADYELTNDEPSRLLDSRKKENQVASIRTNTFGIDCGVQVSMLNDSFKSRSMEVSLRKYGSTFHSTDSSQKSSYSIHRIQSKEMKKPKFLTRIKNLIKKQK